MQRLTYSRYYCGNVAKGHVSLRLYGWGYVEELWTGAVLDTDYMTRSGVFDEQENFLKNSTGADVPFSNILDKGYRLILASLRSVGQYILQPY